MDLQSYQWVYRASLASLAATIFLGTGALLRLFKSENIINLTTHGQVNAVWPEITPEKFAFDATVFKKSSLGPVSAPRGSAANKYRLAGTFFAVGANQQSRKAILDDLQKKEQILVAEGDLIDNGSLVYAIMSDRVILRRGSVEEQILLCFSANARTNDQNMAGTGIKSPPVGLPNRFGKQVGNKRWVLARSELMNYYKEVLNNTDRLAKIYDSLKPVYQGGNIAGYTLVVEGEGEMFNALGLQQGDVIREVNSMPMTSQRRAEYFIGEFVKNRVNGFVLDVERSGRKEKLIYMVR